MSKRLRKLTDRQLYRLIEKLDRQKEKAVAEQLRRLPKVKHSPGSIGALMEEDSARIAASIAKVVGRPSPFLALVK